MKKSANKPKKSNDIANKLLVKKVDPRLRPLALHIILAAVAGIGSYALIQHVTAQQQTQAVTEFGLQAATLIDRQIANWESESKLLAQQPTLNAESRVKAIIGTDGVVPPTLSLTDQDLLNRTHAKRTGAEITHVGAHALITTVVPIPAGGYLISERPFAVLANDLKRITPPDRVLVLSQKSNGGLSLDALKINSTANDTLTSVPLKAMGWQLNVGSVDSDTLNPLTNLPLLAGLITFLGSLLSILAWFFIKPQRIANTVPQPLSDAEQITQLDAVALQLTPSTQSQPQPIQDTVPISSMDAKSDANAQSDIPFEKTIPAITPKTAPENNVITSPQADEYIFPDKTLTLSAAPPPAPVPEPPKDDHLLEFTLSSGALFEAEFFLDQRVPKHIFRAYDIRGKTTDLTADLIKSIASALGSELASRGQTEVVVGFDARTTSEQYAQIMCDGLMACGLHVIDIGRVPTPIMHYAARKHQGNGIMMTASHNPADYNGVKWLVQHQSPLPEDIETIYKRVRDRIFTEGKGNLRKASYTAEYLEDMLNDVVLTSGQHVVIDGMNGVMGELAQHAIETAGCAVVGIDIQPDGSYPHGNPDPCEPHRLTELSRQIVTHKANIGFAFDGDGDRMVAVTQDGTVVTSDQMISLFAMMVLESKPGSDIVLDVKCSRMVSQTITAHGGRPIMSRSGNTFIRHAVMSKENDVTFGGEFSGHYFFNDGRGRACDDGLYAALRLMEWLDHRGQSLEELLQTLPKRVGTADIYLPLDQDLPTDFFEHIATDAAQIADATLTTIDGVRLDFQDGFGIIRASNTGAFVTLRFEAENTASLDHIRQTFHDLVKKQQPGLAEKMPD